MATAHTHTRGSRRRIMELVSEESNRILAGYTVPASVISGVLSP